MRLYREFEFVYQFGTSGRVGHTFLGCTKDGRTLPGRVYNLDTNPTPRQVREREFFIDNLLVRIHCIIVMIRWTGLAPWEFEFPFPGSLTSTFLECWYLTRQVKYQHC